MKRRKKEKGRFFGQRIIRKRGGGKKGEGSHLSFLLRGKGRRKKPLNPQPQ